MKLVGSTFFAIEIPEVVESFLKPTIVVAAAWVSIDSSDAAGDWMSCKYQRLFKSYLKVMQIKFGFTK